MSTFKPTHVALVDIRAQIDNAKRARIELIRRALRERMTQRDIAAAAGVSLSVVSRIAQAARCPYCEGLHLDGCPAKSQRH